MTAKEKYNELIKEIFQLMVLQDIGANVSQEIEYLQIQAIKLDEMR